MRKGYRGEDLAWVVERALWLSHRNAKDGWRRQLNTGRETNEVPTSLLQLRMPWIRNIVVEEQIGSRKIEVRGARMDLVMSFRVLKKECTADSFVADKAVFFFLRATFFLRFVREEKKKGRGNFFFVGWGAGAVGRLGSVSREQRLQVRVSSSVRRPHTTTTSFNTIATLHARTFCAARFARSRGRASGRSSLTKVGL